MSVLTRVVLVTAPATLTTQVIGPTRIDLSWPAVLGAASYRVYRGGVLVDSPGGLTSSSTGLTPSTLYSFRVASVGADGQEGPQGPQASANTTAAADTTAPTAPVLGTPTQSGSNSLIVPMTTQSTDASGIASYSLERATASAGPFTVINTVALFPYTDLGLSASTTYWYRARATDNATNVGSYSNIVSQTTIAQSSTIRFFPGHYKFVDTGSGGGGQSGELAQIAAIAGKSYMTGAKCWFDWDDVEGAQGVYTFTKMDAYVAQAAAIGKKIMLSLRYQYFGGTPTSAAGRFPSYLASIGGQPGYTLWDGVNPASPAGGLILLANLHKQVVMDRFIAVCEAIANRYKDNATVAMFSFGETANFPLPGSGYNTGDFITQIKRWMTAMRAAWLNTEVRMMTNYLDSDAQMIDLMAFMYANRIAGGGPDNFSRTYMSNPVYTGTVGGIDYRNRFSWISESQYPAGSSGGPSATSSQIYAHNETGTLALGGSTKPNYYVWLNNTFTDGGQNHTYPGETEPFIASINGACNTTNPYLTFDFYISPTGSDSNLGTQSSPWAITALSSKSQIAGKRVGLLDGTYDLSGMPTISGGQINLINVLSTSTADTLVAAVNVRQAIIKGNIGTSFPHRDCGLIGCVTTAGRVIIDGLKITGFGSMGMIIGNGANVSGSTRSPGIVVRNCEFTGGDVRTSFPEGQNLGCIKGYALQSPRFQNCWFHDNIAKNGAGSNDHFSDIIIFHANDTLAEYCTFERSGGIFGKWSTTVDVEIGYCYFDFTGYNAETRLIQDWNAENATGFIKVHHSVLIGPQCGDLRPTSGSGGFTSNLHWYNNTVVHTAHQGLIGVVPAGTANIYNNVFYSTASGDQTFLTINLNANGLIDHNLYYNPTDPKWGSYASNSQSGGRTGYSSYTAWKTAMGDNTSGTGCDANSINGSNPLFTMTGTKADRYQLQTLSLAKSAGRSDGTASGTVCDMGAWGGVSAPSRIGCDF